MTALVVATALVRRFAERAVVDGVDLAIAPGESVAIMGPSGCGKTTLLQMIGLLDRPDEGSVTIAGTDAWQTTDRARTTRRLETLGYVFQQSNLIPHLTTRDNVALPAWRLGGSQNAARKTADALLERFGIAHRAAARANELSVGEAQRAAIARAIINKPALILADEPTGSLDADAARVVADALFGLSDVALLVVTHDGTLARRASRTVHMRDGRSVEAG